MVNYIVLSPGVSLKKSIKPRRKIKNNLSILEMGYKLKTHSGAAKRFKKSSSSIKSRSSNRRKCQCKDSQINHLTSVK